MSYLPKAQTCHLQWHITEKCNFQCTHCYMDPELLKNELSIEQMIHVLDMWVDYLQKMGIKMHRNLTMSGGEPILKPGFFKFLEKASQYKSQGLFDRFYIMTNGSTVTDEIIKRYQDLGVNYMQISIEGLEEINDEIRGKGNFARAMKGAEIIIQNKMLLSFSLTVTRKNVGEIEPLARLAAKMGITGMGVGRLVPLGRGEQMRKLMLTPNETRQMYENIIRMNEQFRREGLNFQVDVHCADSLFKTVKTEHRMHGCSTPFDVFTLLPNGDVIPCRRMPLKIGNILKNNFLELYYSNNQMWKLKNLANMSKDCLECTYFNQCRGSGRCVSYGYFGSINAPDPQCWHLFKDTLPTTAKYKDNDVDELMFCQRYVGNLIESLPQIPKDSLNPKIQEIYIQNLESINKLDHSLINIKLKEKDTNLETGKKIIEFFDKLAKNKIEFKLTTPLPPCLFGAEFEKTIQKFKIPKSWEESPAFFRVKNRQIILCSGAKGPELKYMNNLDQIKEYFGLIKSYHIQDVGPDCKNCKYRLREACRYIEGAGK